LASAVNLFILETISVNTEITDIKINRVLYDGDCPLCTRWARRFERTLQCHGFSLATLQSCGECDLSEMRVVTTDGDVFGGADAVVKIARRIWWAWPLFIIAQIPGAMLLLRATYRWLAGNRHCIGGACSVSKKNSANDWFPLILLPVGTFFFRNVIPAWVFMWVMALALYAGCKWLTFSVARRKLGDTKAIRNIGYLLAWPGMDAKAFLNADTLVIKTRLNEWLFASVKTLFGAALIWFLARLAFPIHPLLAGWIGMAGIIFILHFGSFHLLALGWRAAGVNAMPIMRNPLLSCSLTEFWGRRWNAAFHEIVYRFTFRPLLRRAGATAATLIVFLVSGLVHEFVISLPARGGYGLPTAYFLIQGLGIAVERSSFVKNFGLGRGGRGRLFTMLITVGPAFWLFHPPFIRNVILPMLHALGAF
jgi:predicted DCC family thiol-disulfide oxidoreductase YuxK